MIQFGPAQPDDLAAIVALYSDDELGRTREVADLSPYRLAFDEIAADNSQHLVVGRDGDEVVATLQMTVIPNLTRGGSRRAQVEAVHVRSDRQGQGVGTAMMRYAIELARAEGCRLVQLTTDRRRDRVVDFYGQLGFVDSHHGLKLSLD